MPDKWDQYAAQPAASADDKWAQYAAQPSAQPSTPAASMQAAPTDATAWLGDVHSDLMHGGSRTLVGRALGHLQGRGDQGYTGLESGVGEGVANMMGSIPLGVVTAAKGVTQLPSHPLEGAGNIISGGLQAATIPSSFAGPEISEVASNAVSGAGKAIAGKISPTAIKAGAGALFKSAAKDANSVPVNLDNAQEAALKLMDWQKTTNLGPSINKFLKRITDPNEGPLTYKEARNFQQVLGKLSVDESLKLADPIKYDLTQMLAGMKQDIGNAADTVGKAADYYKAMGDYASGKRLEGWYNFAKKTLGTAAIKGAATGIGLGAGGAAGAKIYKEFFE